MKSADSPPNRSGAIAWMARNPVASNLLMAVLVVGGLVVGSHIKQEVFPEFDMDWVAIQVAYPGASPVEVEQGIVLAIEEAVRALDGVKQTTSHSRSGAGSVFVELQLGANPQKVTTDLKNAVDRIQSFPRDAERPIVRLLTNRREVMSVALYGPVDQKALKALADEFRDRLVQHPLITQADVTGLPPTEISIEVPQAALRAHGLTLDGVASQVSKSALELPGGTVKTDAGDVMLRTDERRDLGHEFTDIPIVQGPGGTQVTLGDIATIRDGFAEVDQVSTFNGELAVVIKTYRVGDETPISVAKAVRETMEAFEAETPPTVRMGVLSDWSEAYRQRVDLLMTNAYLGLILVLLILGLFLELRLAFWVTLGIPISFCGALLFLPAQGVSLNMISLFAFIVTLGMVVDDAIIVGENIYQLRQKGRPWMTAAIEGAREVALPVTFSILTTIVAFAPLLYVPGFSGKLFGVIPLVVISVLAISLIESLLVLPAHLGHRFPTPKGGILRAVAVLLGGAALVLRPIIWAFDKARGVCCGGLERFIAGPYARVLQRALHQRYLTIAVGLVMLLATVGWIGGGRIAFTFMPRVESDRVIAKAMLPIGSPVTRTEAVERVLVRCAEDVFEELGGQSVFSRGIYTQLGKGMVTGGPVAMVRDEPGAHLTSVRVRLVPSAQRPFSAADFADRWRERVGELAGVDALSFTSDIMHGAGSSLDIRLSHREVATLQHASQALATELRTYDGVSDIDTGFSSTKPRIDLKLKPAARSLGVTVQDLGRQVRGAFFGAEAFRQQRGRDEMRVYVRLPRDERTSEYDLDSLLIRTPRGGEIPLGVAAEVKRSQADTSISRRDGRRVISVTAEVDRSVTTSQEVIASLTAGPLTSLPRRYPGLGWSFDGERREQQATMKSLGIGFAMAMLMIFGLLAIAFKSYIQPLVVMAAIPFGMVGAVIGHIIMGFNLSVISMMGIVAVSGVVVNDTLVLVDATNRLRAQGHSAFSAIHAASLRRFRPILLTSLTTFFGLLPIIFETSVQARFLIPMAVSLGYGVLFATFIVLGLVPSLYLITEDILWMLGLGAGAEPARPDDVSAAAVSP